MNRRDHSHAPSRAAAASRLAMRFALALAIANAPYWWLGNTLFMSRAVFNVDVAVALCILPAAPVAGIVLLCVAWGADWILSQSLTFHFRTPLEFIHAIRYAAALDYTGFVSWRNAALALPFVASASLLVALTRGQGRLWRPGLVITTLLVLADATNGSSMLSGRGTWRYTVNLAGSPVATLSALALREPAIAPLRTLPERETVQGLVDIPGWAAAHPQGSVLFVIVESLGVPAAPGMKAWLQEQWTDDLVRQRFEVLTADVPFRGSTTSGELRSLCGLTGSYRSMTSQTGERCLPARLARLGWSTVGMHGFSSQMFNRSQWWPDMGLQSTLFVEAPEFHGGRCGAAFRGGCDRDLLAAGMNALGPGRRFVYLLTLNTHLPVDPPPDGTPMPPACREPTADHDVCQHLAATGQVLRDLRHAVASAQPPPLVVVVGDHAPPFADRSSREAFLPDKVPALVLVPRH